MKTFVPVRIVLATLFFAALFATSTGCSSSRAPSDGGPKDGSIRADVASATGGLASSGGQAATGGAVASGGALGGTGGGAGGGGAVSMGGSESIGGTGGSSATGGAGSTGGTQSGSSGTAGSGGATNTGGSANPGGVGGGVSTGGVTVAGGTRSTGGTSAPGTGGKGGASSSGGVAGASATDSNVVAVVVDQGPQNIGYVNGLFVTVTLCEPGSTKCQTIDHLLVDTGSVGVRVLKSAVTLTLPAAKDASGSAIAECTPFVSGTSWGTVNLADLKVGGETANSVPIQVIGEQTYPMPSTCTGTPITDLNTLGSNGILGVGVYLNDCGDACALPLTSRQNPGLYYSCKSNQTGGCKAGPVPVAQQVPSPVAAFPVDNNGVIIQLSSVPAAGAPSIAGTLVFGIGTQSNNGLGSAKVLPLDTLGYVQTAYPVGGTKYSSYLDSGSNGLYFLNAKTANLPMCTGTYKNFYCPTAVTNLGATILGSNGTSADVSFSVTNAAKLLGSTDSAFSNLAGSMAGFPTNPQVPGFDWGLPFYFGRSVYTAIESRATPGGAGPYFAF